MSIFKWFGRDKGNYQGTSIVQVDVPTVDDMEEEVIEAEFVEVSYTSNPGEARYLRRRPKLGSPEWREEFDRRMDEFDERWEYNTRLLDRLHNDMDARREHRIHLNRRLLDALHDDD